MECGATIKLQVQICVFGAAGMRRLAAATHPRMPQVSWLVSWQLPEGDPQLPVQIAERSDFEVIVHRDSGLSRNRNHALDHASRVPYILIGDDDVDYSEIGLQAIIDTFDARADVDVICMRYSCGGSYVKPYGEGEFSLRRPPFGWYVTSFELAFRRRCLRGLRFNERLGLGAPRLVAGEETVFLHDLLRQGADGVGLPVDVGRHDAATTGERCACQPAFLFTYGAVLTHLKPLSWPLRLLLHARRAQASAAFCLRHTLAGAVYALRTRLFRKSYRLSDQ